MQLGTQAEFLWTRGSVSLSAPVADAYLWPTDQTSKPLDAFRHVFSATCRKSAKIKAGSSKRAAAKEKLSRRKLAAKK